MPGNQQTPPRLPPLKRGCLRGCGIRKCAWWPGQLDTKSSSSPFPLDQSRWRRGAGPGIPAEQKEGVPWRPPDLPGQACSVHRCSRCKQEQQSLCASTWGLRFHPGDLCLSPSEQTCGWEQLRAQRPFWDIYLLPCLTHLPVNQRISLHLRTSLERYLPGISDQEHFKSKQGRRG